MPVMDATAKAALDEPVIAPVFFIYIDIDGDPIRVTTGTDVTISGSGDSELDGTYSSISGEVLKVGDVGNQEGGSDTVVIELSGIVSIDTQLLNDIGNRAKWQGRTCRLWMRIHDEDAVAQGAIVPYYTGYGSSVDILPSPETQIIRLNVENYLAAFSEASNRSYLNQKDYDSADISASATIAAANGSRPAQGGTRADIGIPGGGGSGAFRNRRIF